ncbi:hypothetical protein [Rubritalea tangerina]|uniref:hypothetical protein n=1 Tax=Rubritalea tangerina TaxID=430798 RepID=UPI00360C13CF
MAIDAAYKFITPCWQLGTVNPLLASCLLSPDTPICAHARPTPAPRHQRIRTL